MKAGDVRRDLRRRAEALGLDFQQALQYYAIERFLFRLSQTALADKLIVKGAIMLRVWGGAITRPTRDIDFLGRIGNSAEVIRAAIKECLAVDPEDGLAFEKTVAAEQIAIDSRYPGVRIKVRGNLDGARFVLRLDIGIDDAAVPEPGWVDYPTLLEGPAPRILAYHPATAVAEKFEAIVSLGMANSRLKDFYDLWSMATALDFDGAELRDALAATFARRGTALPTAIPAALTNDFTQQDAVTKMWNAFTKKLGTSQTATPNLAEVAGMIIIFIMPVAAATAADQPFTQNWTRNTGWRS